MPKNRSTKETKDLKRKRLTVKQGGICPLCGEALVWWKATLDHIIPKSRGGTWDEWNLRATHGKCNSSRGSAYEDTPAMRIAQQIHQMSGLGKPWGSERA